MTGQPTLFDAPSTSGAVRKRDPQTSLEAARSVPVAHQKNLISAALALAPMTPDQLADHTGIHRSVIASRLAQMRTDLTVVVAGTAPGRCGRTVQLWRLA